MNKMEMYFLSNIQEGNGGEYPTTSVVILQKNRQFHQKEKKKRGS